MCSQYWTLNAEITCPKCKKTALWNLQTHYMGDFGSCMNEYKLNARVKELEDVSITLDGKNDNFIGDCEYCDEYFDLGAEIVKGKVVKVWLLNSNFRQTRQILVK